MTPWPLPTPGDFLHSRSTAPATHCTAALQPLFFGENFPSLLQPHEAPLILPFPAFAFVSRLCHYHCLSVPVSASPSALLLLLETLHRKLRIPNPIIISLHLITIPHSLTPPHPVASSTPATPQPSFPTTTCTTSRYPAARPGQLAYRPPPWQAVRPIHLISTYSGTSATATRLRQDTYMSIMTHPQQPDAFAAYGTYNGGMGNRSPNSTRNGYSTLPSGMGVNRQPSGRQQQQQQQQQMDAASQQGNSMYPMMDRYGILDSITRGPPPTVSGMPGEYMAGNQSAWNYNGSGSSATVNGPIPDVRSRSVNRRPGIPDVSSGRSPLSLLRYPADPHPQQYWMQQPDPTSHPGLGLQAPNQPVYTAQGVPYGQVMNGMDQLRAQPHMFSEGRQSHHEKKDDLIPTAIVIKNIPFNVRKEVLQAIMMEMNLPQPYAFNYHFDNGVFRGLAFANFSSADETRQVIDRMNQLDVQGRKLRVEYKKMLPEHERERIEREKRQKRGQLEEQHRPLPTLQHQASLQSLHSREAEAPASRSSPSRKSIIPLSSFHKAYTLQATTI